MAIVGDEDDPILHLSGSLLAQRLRRKYKFVFSVYSVCNTARVEHKLKWGRAYDTKHMMT